MASTYCVEVRDDIAHRIVHLDIEAIEGFATNQLADKPPTRRATAPRLLPRCRSLDSASALDVKVHQDDGVMGVRHYEPTVQSIHVNSIARAKAIDQQPKRLATDGMRVVVAAVSVAEPAI